VGVPLTILRADETTEFLVLEMGMRGIGHIAYLCQVAEPHITALINVGSAHLGVVGTRDGIARAKGEIVEALPRDGVAVLFGDDPIVMEQAARTGARVVTFGFGEACDVRAARVSLDEQARARFDLLAGGAGAGVALQFHGEHYVANALASAAIALSLGLDLESVAASLTSARPQSKWRMDVRRGTGGCTVINDAYNANPESMRAGLRTLAAMAGGRRTWAVLGDMRELGSASMAEHAAIGRFAAELGISRIVCVGREAAGIHAGATSDASWAGESTLVEDPSGAIGLLAREVGADDVVLVKASRSVGLERVAEALLEGGGE
jgi:UDP-N-acetylmuramoyl-tripeptide--D-alanyl-D-alanine ligase